ncbi:MAG TPA: pimeloyl-ACP methyl ester esterase BioH [Xanthomonadaceae bacterium]|nr:pimeloyl-ACP methyl ester esterase BioH [Xanthomonadaceae bacterium]
MHVEVAGSGPPLVLLHGWAMHGGVFAPLVERLRNDFTLHVVDLPGHGGSRGSDVPLALDACAAAVADVVPDAPWLGWSLGGLVALHAAHAWPARVPALLMTCASPRFVRGDDWPFAVSAEIFREFAAGLRRDYPGTLDRFIALEAFGSDHAREEIRALRAEVLARGEPDAAVLADGLDVLEHADLRAALPSLRVPSLWLAGRRDRLVDPRAMRAAATLAPGASAHVVEHAGHAPFLTHADEVAARVRAFLDTRPVAAERHA